MRPWAAMGYLNSENDIALDRVNAFRMSLPTSRAATVTVRRAAISAKPDGHEGEHMCIQSFLVVQLTNHPTVSRFCGRDVANESRPMSFGEFLQIPMPGSSGTKRWV